MSTQYVPGREFSAQLKVPIAFAFSLGKKKILQFKERKTQAINKDKFGEIST